MRRLVNRKSRQVNETARAGRPVWDRWLWIWNVIYYASLFASLGIAYFSGDYVGSPAIMTGLVVALAAWHALSLLLGIRRPRPSYVGNLVYLVAAVALWVPLSGFHPAFYIVVINFFGQFFGILPIVWAIPMGAALTALLIALQNIRTGDALTSSDVLIAVVVVTWWALLGLWIHAVMRQSQERKRLIDRLDAAQENLAAAERQAGVLEERQRLAREIHDTLAQGFASIVMHLEAADETLPVELDTVRKHLDRARLMARESLAEARRLVQALRPESLERGTLPEALKRVAARWSDETSTRIDVMVTGDSLRLHPDVEVTLLRALQEGLTNVRKHAGAAQVNVTLSYMGNQVSLDMQDDGCGFDPRRLQTERGEFGAGGYGLRAMRERIEQLDGSLSIESQPGIGTTIAVAIPMQSGSSGL